MSKRLLVIDDDEGIRAMLEVALTIEGYDVHTAGDGYEGLAAVQLRQPDAIILDVMMPRLDGHEVLRALRLNPDLDHIPVVLATALSRDDEIWQGWSVGADSYVCKPYDLERLITEVERAIIARAVAA